MEELILKEKGGRKIITVGAGAFRPNLIMYVELEDTINNGSQLAYLTPDQVSSLIAHLTNCLKEVEGEN